jgi:transketolase
MVKTAMAAGEEWPDSPIWSVPSLKPLDPDEIAAICGQHSVVVVLEEHSVFGGLCSAVAEIAGARSPTWICPIGIQDRFSERCGSHAYLMREHGLDAISVVGRVKEFINRLPSGVVQGFQNSSLRAA